MSIFKKSRHLSWILALLTLSQMSWANIKISPHFAVLSSQTKYIKYTVHNASPFKAYVKIHIKEKVCPNEMLGCKQPKLMATEFSKKIKTSPKRFILAANTSRVIVIHAPKIQSTKPKALNIQPIDYNPKSLRTLSQTIKNKANQDIHLKLKIRIAYDSTLAVQARNTRQKKPLIKISQRELKWSNPGSTVTFIKLDSTCNPKTTCKKTVLNPARKLHLNLLYPNKTLRTPLNLNQTMQASYYDDQTQNWKHLDTITR